MKTRLIIFCASLVLLSARSVAAQSADPYAASVSANYDLIYQQQSDVSTVGAHFDGAWAPKQSLPVFGIVGEFGANHFKNLTVTSAMGGARARIPVPDERFMPFVQMLVGLYHCGPCSENDVALQIGGGVDFRMPSHRMRLRAQVDVRHVFPAAVGFDGFRLAGGIVMPFHSR